jgi:hypothetical protein
MAVKRRQPKRRETLSENAEKWLRGEEAGFFAFTPQAELRALWDEYGDHDKFAWTEGQSRPT